MVRKIERDANRFKQIVRGKIKSDLRKYITHGEMIGKTGGELVSIPLPQIEIPEFRYGSKNSGGVGQGPGDVGTPIGRASDGDQPGGAGNSPGHHILEVELTLDELAQILGEGLELPRIQPKGRANIIEEKDKYTGIRQAGPESLRHFKRTYKKALKRQIASNTYDPADPVVIPVREDKQYRSWNPVPLPHSNAVILYLMDVSGSMTDDQKEIVRIESFWIDTWLRSQYQGLESRYIIHDATARVVDRDVFFRTRESGGTMISSAYRVCSELIEKEFPPENWNIYAFHFSDGDNWSVDDTATCISLLRDTLIPACNQFGYGQVESPYGSGQFIKDIRAAFPSQNKLVTSEVTGKDDIMDSIREFLKGGR